MSESSPEPEASADGAAVDDAADAPEYANRAARRAKGKSTGKPEVFAKGQSPAGGRGSVSSPRQYGTRRSG